MNCVWSIEKCDKKLPESPFPVINGLQKFFTEETKAIDYIPWQFITSEEFGVVTIMLGEQSLIGPSLS